MSQCDGTDQEGPGNAAVDRLAACPQLAGVEEPTFLGPDHVCTELPTHITRARTKEQQSLIDQIYAGWTRET